MSLVGLRITGKVDGSTNVAQNEDDFPKKHIVSEISMADEQEVLDSVVETGPDRLAFKYRNYFLYSGLVFIFAALALLMFSGYMLFRLSEMGPNISVPEPFDPEGNFAISGDLSQRDVYNFFGRIASFFLAPILGLISGVVCAIIGIRLLTSSGAVTSYVIAPHDYPVLGPAISSGNEAAVTQFIRLSSLSGLTGTFTKIGLTGLPLATIFLTIFLALLGLADPQFFDLAKLTLGAFLGSFVQKEASKKSESDLN